MRFKGAAAALNMFTSITNPHPKPDRGRILYFVISEYSGQLAPMTITVTYVHVVDSSSKLRLVIRLQFHFCENFLGSFFHKRHLCSQSLNKVGGSCLWLGSFLVPVCNVGWDILVLYLLFCYSSREISNFILFH